MKRIVSLLAFVLAFALTSVASYAQTAHWSAVGTPTYLSSELYGGYAHDPSNVPEITPEEVETAIDGEEEEEEEEEKGKEEEPSKFFSGSIVGIWKDGYGRGANATQLEQIWLTSERAVDTEANFVDFGYRVDALFGVNNLQSYGDGGFDGKWGVSEDGYGASMFQAYGEIGVGKFSFKAGKFGTLLGYESVDSSETNFNTHSVMYDHEPATHSGGLFSFQATDKFSVDFGLVSGADGSFENRRGDTGFLFGATWDVTDNFSIGYAGELNQVHSALGEDRAGLSFGYYDELGGLSVGDTSEYLQSIIFDWNLSEKWSYGFATNYGGMSDRAEHRARYSLFGVANYLTYDVTDKLTSALRYEYFTERLEEAGKTLVDGTDELQCHELSYGLVYRPSEHIFIRPEARYDWTELAEKSNGFTGSVGFGATF